MWTACAPIRRSHCYRQLVDLEWGWQFFSIEALDEAYVPFFGAFGAAWDDVMVAHWRANPVAMVPRWSAITSSTSRIPGAVAGAGAVGFDPDLGHASLWMSASRLQPSASWLAPCCFPLPAMGRGRILACLEQDGLAGAPDPQPAAAVALELDIDGLAQGEVAPSEQVDQPVPARAVLHLEGRFGAEVVDHQRPAATSAVPARRTQGASTGSSPCSLSC